MKFSITKPYWMATEPPSHSSYPIITNCVLIEGNYAELMKSVQEVNADLRREGSTERLSVRY